MKTIIIVMLLALSACATKPVLFQPGTRVSVAEEQMKSALRGRRIYSGMSCWDWCDITGMCNSWEMMRAKRMGCIILSPVAFQRALRR